MRKIFIAGLLTIFVLKAISQTTHPKTVSKQILLPNGWSLSPVGKSLPLGDLPLNIAVSATGRYIAVTNNGQSTQTIQLIDPRKELTLDSVVIPKSWLGLRFSKDEKWLYASGGNDNRILKYAIKQNKLLLADSLVLGAPWPVKISPTGFDIDDSKQILYVVTKENNSLYILDLKTKKIIRQLPLPGEAYTCLLSPQKKLLYISCWGCDQLLIFDINQGLFKPAIATGNHPNDFCLTKNGHFIFLANANDNSVSVINTSTGNIVETLDAAVYPHAPAGSTTNSVALSRDEKTLYIANADNNCLAVFDVHEPGKSASKGFIPVGWYPTCVRVIGSTIFVANGKGYTSLPNPGYRSFETSLSHQKGAVKNEYIGGLFRGTLSMIPEPSPHQMAQYSAAVYHNTPYSKEKESTASGEIGNPIPMKLGDPAPIKYVFYILKENRTYDQVLGDITEGNGDTSLVLFGRKVTPNLHALAEEFVLLDNFYVNAEVSADGHNWSMGGYATDYLEKTWPTSYGGRGGSYDGEGNRAIANNKGGFIWDYCQRAGVSFRTYGEFADNYQPNLPVLKNHYCRYYTSWDQTVRDTTRVNQWKRDFDSLLSVNAVPRLNTLRIINDHTEGLRLGRPTPFAHCADNDLAVGMFVDYLSHTSIWKESVVFVVEDDAQDGPDHVDAHRSTAYIAGGYVKRRFVDHTLYSTTSILKTIELILAIPPMSQYDAASNSFWKCFQSSADTTPFIAKPLQVNINDKNTVQNAWQRKSESFDFSKEDKIPDREFTEVIWKAVKGDEAKVPAPKRAAFVNTIATRKDKDDD